jgi:hypothetical protein
MVQEGRNPGDAPDLEALALAGTDLRYPFGEGSEGSPTLMDLVISVAQEVIQAQFLPRIAPGLPEILRRHPPIDPMSGGDN